MIYYGFEPLFDSNCKILILGSFPSVKSRQTQFYYGNKQNRFWKMLCEFFGETVETVEEKKDLCLRHNIALWDIVKSCQIKGSMDTDIKDYELADLNEILSRSPITKILCNGAKAYELTTKVLCGLPITTFFNAEEERCQFLLQKTVIRMPSTSPANVSFDKQKWFDELAMLK